MEMILIRHLATAGNEKRQYIGRTDEPLSQHAKASYRKAPFYYTDVSQVIVSPMRRCIETAELLYPGKRLHIQKLLKECDFGEFEGKSYEELKEDSRYIRWLASNGTLPFPKGESQEVFRKRCVQGFKSSIETLLIGNEVKKAAFVVHGGTIMAILSALDEKERGFYAWQAANGKGYRAILEEKKFREGKRCMRDITPLKAI